MSWASRLAALSEAKSLYANSADSAESPKDTPIDINGTIDNEGICTKSPFVDDPIEREAMPVRHLRPRAAGHGHPQPGDYCGCCKGSLWWTETETPKGWRCCCCHPPAHLEPGQFRAMAT